MLEYLSYKKYRQHKEEKERQEDVKGKGPERRQSEGRDETSEGKGRGEREEGEEKGKTQPDTVPVLDRDEQSFLENLTRHWGREDEDDGDGDGDGAGNGDNSERPPLPPRMKTPDLAWDSDSESFVREEREEPPATKDASGIGRRLSTLFRKKDKAAANTTPGHLAVPGTVDIDAGEAQLVLSAAEQDRERAEIARVLDDLDLGKAETEKDSKGKRFAMTLSAESAALVRRFVVVLKDLVNGVPTAADDLKALLDDRDGTLARGFDKLPASMRKLVAQLPTKLTSTLAPELLAAAAESQGIKLKMAKDDGLDAKAAAKAMLLPLVTKPTAIVKMLKAIMNALKLRWPAFIGTSAIWSVALFLLMFVLWYCHKRGREVRLEKEAGEAGDAAASAADGEPAESVADGEPAEHAEPSIVVSGTDTGLPRPPIGPDAP